MSLRTDIHNSLDVISPPAGGLVDRVVETAMREARVRQRRRRFMLRLRAPITLVAVLVLIAIVAAAVVGGRLISGWYGEHTVSPPHLTVGPTLSELEARPWQHDLVAGEPQCAGTEVNGTSADNKDSGPVFANPLAGPFVYPWGEYSSGEMVYEEGFSGLAIVRLRDGQKGTTHFFISDNARGPVVATVDIGGQQVDGHAEAVFDLSDPKVKPTNGFKTYKMHEAHLSGFSLCFEWQLDGTYRGQPFVKHWYFYG